MDILLLTPGAFRVARAAALPAFGIFGRLGGGGWPLAVLAFFGRPLFFLAEKKLVASPCFFLAGPGGGMMAGWLLRALNQIKISNRSLEKWIEAARSTLL